MDRLLVRQRIAAALVLMVAALALCGCQSVLVTPPLTCSRGTKCCSSLPSGRARKWPWCAGRWWPCNIAISSVARDLAQQVTTLLEKNVPKIQVVDQRKVNKWIDENTWEEYREVGKGVKAEMLVGIDLESFSIYQGQTLYQGKANAIARRLSIVRRMGRRFRENHAAVPLIRPTRAFPPPIGWRAISAASSSPCWPTRSPGTSSVFHHPDPDMAQDPHALQ